MTSWRDGEPWGVSASALARRARPQRSAPIDMFVFYFFSKIYLNLSLKTFFVIIFQKLNSLFWSLKIFMYNFFLKFVKNFPSKIISDFF
jgi:hypothetical protein